MDEKQIAEYLEHHNFIEEMRLYLERLQNGRDYSPWKAFVNSDKAIVEVSMAKNNRLTIKAYEAKETQLKEELAHAEETIKEQAKEIKSLKKEAKTATTKEIKSLELAENFVETPAAEPNEIEPPTPEPKRRRKTENP